MKKLVAVCVAVCAAWLGFADALITGVTARQRYPWNGKVDISYSVSGVESTAKEAGQTTSVTVSAVDQTTSTTNVAVSLSGDLSLADGTHHVVWDMGADGLAFKSTDVVFRVTVEVKPSSLYCVIDLSVGTSAASYPVSYLADVPAGGWTDEYKMTKLVLRRIPAGTFAMGSPAGEVGLFYFNDEETQHQVTLTKDYWMGVFGVAQRQWELVMGTRPSGFNNDSCYAAGRSRMFRTT